MVRVSVCAVDIPVRDVRRDVPSGMQSGLVFSFSIGTVALRPNQMVRELSNNICELMRG